MKSTVARQIASGKCWSRFRWKGRRDGPLRNLNPAGGSEIEIRAIMAGLSVVSCCHNGASPLPITLAHLKAQEPAGAPWEALLIDNASPMVLGIGSRIGIQLCLGTLAYICSNLGVFGLALSLSVMFGTAFSYLRASTGNTARNVALMACSAAFSADPISVAISGAEISNPRIWVVWGMPIASLRGQTRAVDAESYDMVGQSSLDSLYPSSILGWPGYGTFWISIIKVTFHASGMTNLGGR